MTYPSPFLGHAAERASERHGLTPTGEDMQQALLDIIDTASGFRCAAVLLRRFPDGNERWIVKLSGRAVRVVYSSSSATIMTVLPDTSWRKKGHK